jgi:hypothetical protein
MRKIYTGNYNEKVEFAVLLEEVANYMSLQIYRYNYNEKRVLYYQVFIHHQLVFPQLFLV